MNEVTFICMVRVSLFLILFKLIFRLFLHKYFVRKKLFINVSLFIFVISQLKLILSVTGFKKYELNNLIYLSVEKLTSGNNYLVTIKQIIYQVIHAQINYFMQEVLSAFELMFKQRLQIVLNIDLHD